MNIWIIVLLLAGTSLGSFVNAWVWRTHELSKPKSKRASTADKLSVTTGKSMCPHCQHELAWKDLVPVASWLSLGGKCRYCKRAISWQYPVVEISVAVLFFVSFIFWPTQLDGMSLQTIIFGLWLILLVVLVALTVYDLRWMLLPNTMVFVAGMIVFAVTMLRIIDSKDVSVLGDAAMGLVAFGGTFWLLFQLSQGRWIGGGDVKLGFVLGALLASPVLSMLAIFCASLIGSVIACAGLATNNISLKSKVPFGPMLIAGTIVVFFYGNQLADWYINDLLLTL